MRLLDKLQPLALLLLRVALGTIVIVHSYHIVFGGMAGFRHMVAGLGYPWWTAYLSKYTEFFGGILVIAGFLTRLWGLGLAIDMTVVITKVLWKNGLTGQGNFQLELALAVIAFSLLSFGGGPLSVDAMLWRRRRTPVKKT